jgi:hypothetical protein
MDIAMNQNIETLVAKIKSLESELEAELAIPASGSAIQT